MPASKNDQMKTSWVFFIVMVCSLPLGIAFAGALYGTGSPSTQLLLMRWTTVVTKSDFSTWFPENSLTRQRTLALRVLLSLIQQPFGFHLRLQ